MNNVNLYVAIVMKGAIKLYIDHKIKANRSYTPTNMLRKASELTGKPYKRSELRKAYNDLEEMINAHKA